MRRSDGLDQPIQQHVGRIGNLALLPGPLNAEAKIRPFDEKNKITLSNNLRMLREISSETKWTLVEIERREEKIVNWAKSRWADL